MKIGDTASITRQFTHTDLAAFSGLCGRRTAAPACVPEPLIGALFSYLLGVKVPGPGTNYLKQELDFLETVAAEARLTARVTITRLRPEKHLCDLETILSDDAGRVLVRGRALVFTRDVTQP
jgi:3-hydroxybutyryl-CoA dehydratase